MNTVKCVADAIIESKKSTFYRNSLTDIIPKHLACIEYSKAYDNNTVHNHTSNIQIGPSHIR